MTRPRHDGVGPKRRPPQDALLLPKSPQLKQDSLIWYDWEGTNQVIICGSDTLITCSKRFCVYSHTAVTPSNCDVILPLLEYSRLTFLPHIKLLSWWYSKASEPPLVSALSRSSSSTKTIKWWRFLRILHNHSGLIPNLTLKYKMWGFKPSLWAQS